MRLLFLCIAGGILSYATVYKLRGGSVRGGVDLRGQEAVFNPDSGTLASTSVAGGGLLERINQRRGKEHLAGLVWGKDVEKGLMTFPDLIAPDMEALLKHLQLVDKGAASVSVWHLIADSEEEFFENVVKWERLSDPEVTHFAVTARPVGQQWACAAAAVRRVAEFSLAGLHRGPNEYVRDCPICNETHSVRFEDPNSTVVIACPHCRREYDLIAFGSDGRYHRANQFLTGFSPPASYRSKEPDLELMFAIWQAVLDHCSYRHDRFATDSGEEDEGSSDEIWRFGRETYRARYGDCEDTSILLAEWLANKGFDARVAVGLNNSVGAHAWCVVNFEGNQYLLETTNAEPDMSRPPLVTEFIDEYTPKQLFDRDRIYFVNERSSRNPGEDYWSKAIWNEVDYSIPAEKSGQQEVMVDEIGRGWGGEGSTIPPVVSSIR